MSVAPSVSSPFAQQAHRPGPALRPDARAERAEPFVLPPRDVPRPERERHQPAASEAGPRAQPVQRNGASRTGTANAADQREDARDARRLAEAGTQQARDTKVESDPAQQEDAARNANEPLSAAEAAADRDQVDDNATPSGLSDGLVLQAQTDKGPMIAQAVEQAQDDGHDGASSEEKQPGVDAATTTAAASLSVVVKTPAGNASSGNGTALSDEAGAVSGAVAGVSGASPQATIAGAQMSTGVAAALGEASSSLQAGHIASATQGLPEVASDVAKTADKPNAITPRLPSQPDQIGGSGKTVDFGKDIAKDAASSAAKTELMSLLEQGTGGTPQLQAKQGDVPPLKPDLLPPPEAPLPQGAKAIPPSAVPVEIGLRTLQGLREFQIRLDPAELGRVDVRLEINDDKTVSARVVVDRVETLHLLQRDAKTLERAFEQAGLKSSDSAIDITLRDPGQQARQDRGEAWAGEGQVSGRRNAAAAIVEPAVIPIRRTLHVGALDRSI